MIERMGRGTAQVMELSAELELQIPRVLAHVKDASIGRSSSRILAEKIARCFVGAISAPVFATSEIRPRNNALKSTKTSLTTFGADDTAEAEEACKRQEC